MMIEIIRLLERLKRVLLRRIDFAGLEGEFIQFAVNVSDNSDAKEIVSEVFRSKNTISDHLAEAENDEIETLEYFCSRNCKPLSEGLRILEPLWTSPKALSPTEALELLNVFFTRGL